MSPSASTYPAMRTAIVTGGSSGIGLACARKLVQSGWNVFITGRNQESLKLAQQDINQNAESTGKAKASYVVGDASIEEDVVRLFNHVMNQHGKVDLVFCNAGISPPALLIEDFELSDWQAAVNTNLTSMFLCAREAFRKMKMTGGGRIIINGSISAHVPRPNSAAYTSTKHGVTGLTKSLALDGRKYNISVSQIDIGNAASNMTQKMTEGQGVLQADGCLRPEPVMSVEYVALEVKNIAELPLEVSKLWVVIQASAMPSMVGRG